MAIMRANLSIYFAFLASVAGFAVAAPALNSTNVNSTNAACQELANKYPNQLYLPSSLQYANETASYYSREEVLQPYCVFAPASAQQVAQGLSVFRSTKTQFAVRGAGHMTVKGAASINQGVLLVMTGLKTLEISSDHSIAQVGPGLTWLEVYDWISNYGRVVVGGRYAPVGVPGYLLGGGISFLSGERGWGANNIKNYQVVTADGRIIDVNANSNSDLFWALKGGSNNFGIITRFDLKTYPANPIFGGTISYGPSEVPQYIDALDLYCQSPDGIDNPKTATLPNIFIDPASGNMTVAATIFHDGTDQSSFQNFTAIPTVSNTAKVRNFTDFISESVSSVDRSFRDVFNTRSLKISAHSVRLINDSITALAISSLKDVEGSQVSLSVQPVATSWLKAAKAAGGDAIDLDPADGNFIAFNLYTRWSNAADDAVVKKFTQGALDALEKASRAQGLYYPFLYLNDAGGDEDVYSFYGKGKSLARMRAIRRQYDPNGVFQTLQPGGFKLGV